MDTPLGRLMAAQNLTDEDAAAACDVTPGWIWQLRNAWKGKTPRADLADRLLQWVNKAAPGHSLTLDMLLFPTRYPDSADPSSSPPVEADEPSAA